MIKPKNERTWWGGQWPRVETGYDKAISEV